MNLGKSDLLSLLFVQRIVRFKIQAILCMAIYVLVKKLHIRNFQTQFDVFFLVARTNGPVDQKPRISKRQQPKRGHKNRRQPTTHQKRRQSAGRPAADWRYYAPLLAVPDNVHGVREEF